MEKQYKVSSGSQPEPVQNHNKTSRDVPASSPFSDRRVQIGIISAAVIAVILSVVYSTGLVGGASAKPSWMTLRTREKNHADATGADLAPAGANGPQNGPGANRNTGD